MFFPRRNLGNFRIGVIRQAAWQTATCNNIVSFKLFDMGDRLGQLTHIDQWPLRHKPVFKAGLLFVNHVGNAGSALRSAPGAH